MPKPVQALLRMLDKTSGVRLDVATVTAVSWGDG